MRRIPGSLPVPDSAESLQRRLDAGYERIEIARSRNEDITAWEDFWIELLHQYEAECDAAYDASVPIGRYAPNGP